MSTIMPARISDFSDSYDMPNLRSSQPLLASLKSTFRRPQFKSMAESTKRPPTISALLIDVSGTLLVGSEPTTSAVDAFNRLISSDVPVRLCSNTSKESTADLVQNMTSLGFTLLDVPLTKVDPSIRGASPEGRSGGTKLVWTSIGAVAQTLKDLGRNTPYLLLSDSAKAEVLNALHPSKPDLSTMSMSNEMNYDSVVIGLAPTLLDYEHLNTAFRILKGEMPSAAGNPPCLIATHRAKFIQSTTGQLSLGPGPFVAALENAASPNVQVKVVGKPEKAFFEMVINDFGDLGNNKSANPNDMESPDPGRIAVIGDDIEADLGGGAIELGLWRVLVKTGKYRAGAESRPGVIPPDEIHDSFASFVECLFNRQNKA